MQVYDIALHPNYGFTNLNNDIAILKLGSMLKYTEYVQPICMWDRNELDKKHIFDKTGVVRCIELLLDNNIYRNITLLFYR